ncbi:SacI homology domain-containing protein [Gigaspora rosea]|uniref:SacI homology domain-containing protein n=1 Tax=Gigaspora rosea TaxID=44941 RepID=A0A397V687_9GLOM|nr:SacI homology domain-containing protein [Gigaspora rosea]
MPELRPWSAWTDFGRRRSPSLYSNGSDSEDYDKDTEWEAITSSVNETYVNQRGLLAFGKGFANDIGGPKAINVRDPIEKRAMDTRISKEIVSLFRSDAFFYSYELDIATSLQQKYERGQLKDQPLWKQINKKFWWNEHILKSFIELELHAWILPIMQGYVQSEHCEIEDRVFDFIIISRRSRERPAFAKHFDMLLNTYGHTNCINLVESNGREAAIGTAYREALRNLGHKDIDYVESDFHKECKGMKYENISKLSALARDVLNLQLLRLGISELATIDYFLGNHSLEVFQELQQKFEASQPGDAERWAKVRANAIDISSSIVIVDNEEKVNGWTFLSSSEPNTVRSKSYEEKVLLLTQKALYVCTFHYRLEKVIQFKRIGLGVIICIQKVKIAFFEGEYILSTLYPSCVTPEDNYGFVIYYRASGESSRVNSGSMRNNNNTSNPSNKTNDTGTGTNTRSNSGINSSPMSFKSENEDKRFIAFKAFRSNLVEATKFDGGAGETISNSLSNTIGMVRNTNKGTDEDKTAELARERVTSKQVVNEVVDELAKACSDIGNAEDAMDLLLT